MESTAENTNVLERRLDLSVALADIEQDLDKRLQRLGRTIKMPGFRPGKVPAKIVKQQYGAQTRYEIMSEKLDEAFYQAATEQGLRVAGQPRLEPKEGADSTTHVEFTAIFEVYPEITLGDLSSATIERPQFEVTAAEVDKTLNILRQQRVSYVDANRAAAKEDRVVIDFLGKKDGEPFSGGQANDYPFVLGQGMMLSEFEAAIEGAAVGESKTFDMTFPEDYFAKDLAGQTVQFDITVKQVQAPQLPEVDAEFVKSLGVADGDVDKMRGEIEANLKREVKKRIETKVKDQVMEALLAANPIAVPSALVAQETERLVQAAREDMANRGMKTQDLPIQGEWFADQAKRRVTLGLILAELVKKEELKAKPEQVKAMIEEMAQSYEQPEDVVNWYYAQPERLSDVEAVAVENNVVAWVLGQASVTDTATSFDELMGQKA